MLKTETIKKLREVQNKIKLHPLQFFMSGYFTDSNPTSKKNNEEEYSCGTAACIAGWAISNKLMAEEKLPLSKICKDGKNETGCVQALAEELNATFSWCIDEQTMAAKILGITQDQAQRLFLSDNWPRPFYAEYIHDDHCKLTYEQRVKNAKVAVARIEHFIKTGGKE